MCRQGGSRLSRLHFLPPPASRALQPASSTAGGLGVCIMAASVSHWKLQAGEESSVSSVSDLCASPPPKYLIIRHFSESGCFLLTQSRPRLAQ